MNIQLHKAKSEQDFVKILDMESRLSKAAAKQYAPLHAGGLIFDRYMFGGGADDFFDYGHLIYAENTLIGYALCYFEESLFVLRLLPGCEHLYRQAVKAAEMLFDGEKCSVLANSSDTGFTAALEGYCREGEEDFQAVLDLSAYAKQPVSWEKETIAHLQEKDIKYRVMYGDIPTGEQTDEDMYIRLMQSPYYSRALDHVIHEKATGLFAGFATWWADENSNTALLEPVACLPEFRRRGIMKKALLHGLNELKDRKITLAYVHTSMNNIPAQSLYLSVGFQKIGTVYRYTKFLG